MTIISELLKTDEAEEQIRFEELPSNMQDGIKKAGLQHNIINITNDED